VSFHRKKIYKIMALFLCVVGILVAGRLWYLDEQGNFHPITPGEAYRSAQLDRDELEDYLARFNIRSVLNLRGKKEGRPWYEEETAVCRDLGVRHYGLRLSAEKAPDPKEIEELLRIFRSAPRPVLIHCKAGADRSGLAAALWKVVNDGTSKSVARRQLSIRYGHMPLGPTQALDDFFEGWEPPAKLQLGATEKTRRLEYADS
jgi:protein tyrosine/serine phosphatase